MRGARWEPAGRSASAATAADRAVSARVFELGPGFIQLATHFAELGTLTRDLLAENTGGEENAADDQAGLDEIDQRAKPRVWRYEVSPHERRRSNEHTDGE